MNVQTTLYIRQIENGFVIGYGGRQTLAGPTNSEHFFPDLDTLTDNAPGIIGDAIAAAQADAAEMASQIARRGQMNRPQMPGHFSEAAQGAIIGPY